jgi:hypothetical protein
MPNLVLARRCRYRRSTGANLKLSGQEPKNNDRRPKGYRQAGGPAAGLMNGPWQG